MCFKNCANYFNFNHAQMIKSHSKIKTPTLPRYRQLAKLKNLKE